MWRVFTWHTCIELDNQVKWFEISIILRYFVVIWSTTFIIKLLMICGDYLLDENDIDIYSGKYFRWESDTRNRELNFYNMKTIAFISKYVEIKANLFAYI